MTAKPFEIQEYMSDDEEVSYTLEHRPTGFFNWIRSLFGYGVTHWFVTNQRIIEHTRVAGGFNFRDVGMDKVSSVEYGQKLNLILVGMGVLLSLFGLGLMVEDAAGLVLVITGAAMVAWAFYRRSQAVIVRGSGGVKFSLAISQGTKVDEFLWYAHAERQKHTGTTTTPSGRPQTSTPRTDGGRNDDR